MPVIPYLGTYARFSSANKDESTALLSADSIIGNEVHLRFEKVNTDDGTVEELWLDNRFGHCIGKLDANFVGQVQLCRAKDWDIHALLASVWCTNEPDGVHYWGEVILLSYPKGSADSFDVFKDGIAKMITQGIRPKVDLQQSSLAKIVEADGAWEPNGRVEKLNPERSVLVKSRMQFNESVVEAARNRNPGCMVAGWAFIVLIILGVLYLIARLAGIL